MEGEERSGALIVMIVVFVAFFLVFAIFAFAASDAEGGISFDIFGSFLKQMIGLFING